MSTRRESLAQKAQERSKWSGRTVFVAVNVICIRALDSVKDDGLTAYRLESPDRRVDTSRKQILSFGENLCGPETISAPNVQGSIATGTSDQFENLTLSDFCVFKGGAATAARTQTRGSRDCDTLLVGLECRGQPSKKGFPLRHCMFAVRLEIKGVNT